MATVKICGTEHEYHGLTEDRRGIKVASGFFWTEPFLLTSTRESYAREVEGLQPYPPREIKRITFEFPDLTHEFPDTVQQAYDKQRQYYSTTSFDEHIKEYPDCPPTPEQFDQGRKAILEATLDEFAQTYEARRAVWLKHGSKEIAARHGYQPLAVWMHLRISLMQQMGYSAEGAAQAIREITHAAIYDDAAEIVIYLKWIKMGEHPPSHQGMEKKLDAIQQSVNAVGTAYYEVQKARDRLQQMRGEKLFAFVNGLDPESFRILCSILAHGTVAKSSRALNMSDSTLRSKINGWKGRGRAYDTALDLVRWRKAMGAKEEVPLNEAITSGTAANVDFEGLLVDVLDLLSEMTDDNWDEKADALIALLRPYAAQSRS